MKKRRGRKRLQLTGQRFGHLIVTSFAGMAPSGKSTWHCTCDCGDRSVVAGDKLKTSHTTSCGCVKRNVLGDLNRTHGLTGTVEHRLWKNMRTRCNDPNHSDYHLYGGRGVTVCKRWDSFEAFLSDMGKRPSNKHTLDRVDPNRDYSPSNCRWATWQQQRINQRRHNPNSWLPPKDYRPEIWKLTAEEIEQIRELRAAGKTHRELAAMFDVSPATISNSLRRPI